MAETGVPPSGIESLAKQYAGCDSSRLLIRNRRWARAMTRGDKGYFKRHERGQKPAYFWIGCSDSRVSATRTLDLDPGEIFVHRNVANLAREDDPNFAASLHYAIETLAVRHILVVGHYGCGGIHSAMEPLPDNAVGDWLCPVRTLCCTRCISDANRLTEHNVSAQVEALTRNATVRKAWARGAKLVLHGWVYDLRTGLLNPVCRPVSAVPVPPAVTEDAGSGLSPAQNA